MSDPFRNEDHAALFRVAQLEEENERLRHELEEAKKPKPKPPSKPIPFRLMSSVAFLVLGVLGVGVAATRSVSKARVLQTPKALETSTPTPARIPTATIAPLDWQRETASDVDLHAIVQGAQPPTAYAVGAGGTIVRRYEAASQWTAEASATTRDLFAVAEGLGKVCSVGAGGVATCCLDPATPKWKTEKTGTNADLLGVVWDAGDFIAVGRGGVIVQRLEGAWRAQSSGTKSDLFAIDGVYAVGAGGVILRRERFGSKWTRVPSGTTEDLFSVAVHMSDVVVVGAHGTILRLTDPRDGFRSQPSNTTSDLFGVAHGPGYDFYAVGSAGTILRSLSATSGWELQTGGGLRDLRAVFGSIPTMYVVGDGGVMLSRRRL